MESFPVQFCRKIRLHWRRRRYQRLEGSAPSQKSLRTAKLGGGGGGGRGNNGGGGRGNNTGAVLRRAWKIRRAFRLRVRLSSPMKLFARVRDAYVSAMLGVAGKGSGLSGVTAPDTFWAKRIPRGRPVSAAAPPVDFETRMLVEIYKSFLSPRELAAF